MDERSVEAVRRAFDLPVGILTPEPVARGQLGAVYRYDAQDGSRWAVKHLTPPVTEGEVAPAAAFEDAARRHGVPAPGVRRTGSGTVLAQVDGGTYRVSPWVDLQPDEIGLDAAAVGGLLAALHTVPADAPAVGGESVVHSWYVDPVGATVWDDLVSRARSSDAPFARPLAAYRDELVALEGLLVPPTGLRTCHRDLFADNVRATRPGAICVIDFDNSGPADPSQELAFVLVEFATDEAGAVDPTRGQTLLEAYVATGGPGRLTGPGSFSMAVAVLGHLAELGVRRWLSAADAASTNTATRGAATREAATPMVTELLDRPLTRDVIDRMLALS